MWTLFGADDRSEDVMEAFHALFPTAGSALRKAIVSEITYMPGDLNVDICRMAIASEDPDQRKHGFLTLCNVHRKRQDDLAWR